MVEDCIFCKMVDGQIPITKIYEDDFVLAFLDIGPLSDGHALLIPKEHFEKLDECTPELLGQVASRLSKIAKAVCSAVQAEGYNVLCNNGRSAGQLVNHMHFHIIPRNTDDKLFPSWPSYKYPDGKAEEIAKKVLQNL
ncbi:MAG: HIT family protein [Planctomycetota bacterium]|jgi:histidine triad (HIT) family protein